MLADLERGTIEKALAEFPYIRFIYQPDRQPPCIVLRKEMIEAVDHSRSVPIHPNPTCLRSDTIAHIQRLLVESSHGIALVLDRENGRASGLVTLHDLLRSQQGYADQHGDA